MNYVITFNRKLSKLLLICLIGLGLAACSDEPAQNQSAEQSTSEQQVAVDNNVQPDSSANEEDEKFEPNYISADDLGGAFEKGVIPFIFDVRSTHAFEKSHIESSYSMPFGKTTDDMLAAVDGLDKSSAIVTYCGCPRHLSTLSAENLTERGYTNVRVLYEGYWHWIDHGFPTVYSENTAESISTIKFNGQLQAKNQQTQSSIPLADKDIFLRHRETGQLEAARTDAYGGFTFDFHLYDLDDQDQFEVIVSDLDHSPVKLVTITDADTQNLVITL